MPNPTIFLFVPLLWTIAITQEFIFNKLTFTDCFKNVFQCLDIPPPSTRLKIKVPLNSITF